PLRWWWPGRRYHRQDALARPDAGPPATTFAVPASARHDGPVQEIMGDLRRWRAQGKRVALARVVDVEGSAPRPAGAAMAVTEDGEVAGSVSGGCVEGTVVATALEVLET